METRELTYFFFNSNDGKKPEVEKIVDKLLLRFGGINDSDLDDFYSLAGLVFTKVTQTYDESKGIPFKSYYKRCLSNKIMEMITARNAIKRRADREAISISTTINSADDDIELGETISDPKTEVEARVFSGKLSESTERYLAALTRKQRRMADLIMAGAEEADIMRIMNIGYAEYQRILTSMRDFELASILGNKEG